MSTEFEVSTQPAETSSNPLSVVSETITLAVTKNLKKPEAAPGFGEYKEGNALWKRSHPSLKKSPETGKDEEDFTTIDTEILLTIDVTYPIFNSLAGVSEVIPDEQEILNLLNGGAYTKLIGQIRAKATAVADNGDLVNAATTAYSLDETSAIIAEPLKRQKMTTVQKASKILQGLSPDELNELLKSMGVDLTSKLS